MRLLPLLSVLLVTGPVVGIDIRHASHRTAREGNRSTPPNSTRSVAGDFPRPSPGKKSRTPSLLIPRLEEDGSHGQKAQVAKHAQMESMLELEAEKPQSKKWKFRRLEDVDKQGRTVNVQEAVELQAKKGSRRKSEVHEGETSPTRMEEEDQTTSLLATENNVKHKIKKVKEKGRTSGELEEEQHQETGGAESAKGPSDPPARTRAEESLVTLLTVATAIAVCAYHNQLRLPIKALHLHGVTRLVRGAFAFVRKALVLPRGARGGPSNLRSGNSLASVSSALEPQVGGFDCCEQLFPQAKEKDEGAGGASISSGSLEPQRSPVGKEPHSRVYSVQLKLAEYFTLQSESYGSRIVPPASDERML